VNGRYLAEHFSVEGSLGISAVGTHSLANDFAGTPFSWMVGFDSSLRYALAACSCSNIVLLVLVEEYSIVSGLLVVD
jgi:hypothetical protein